MMKFVEEIERWKNSGAASDDRQGALEKISESKVIESLRIPSLGRIYRLSHTLSEDIAYRPTHGPFFYSVTLRSVDYHEPFRGHNSNEFGANIGRLEMSDHSGTHIDSLNHISVGGFLHGKIRAADSIGPRGSSTLGIDDVQPVVTRGVVIDYPRILGVDIAEQGAPNSSDIEKFLKAEGIEVMPGDAVFLYTGASRIWNDHIRFSKLYDKAAGIGLEMAEWMVKHGVSLSGSDSPSTEVSPAEISGSVLPVHQYLITMNGIRLIDNMKLDELARDRKYEFLLVCAPLPIRGGTGSPVSPVAIV
ncbi:MAG: cyclase family protein [Candidatus Thermoplasmatota archaeon]|nr:cyclase family protein [Candidatus Thermoplasmatota archaeon]